ncbi:MAG: glucosamine-6-phosphate synthase, partial [bacterium]|nr:glucosamine-6-phosphate synthase [bacterium]
TQIAATVRRSGLGRTYWAVVGNGRNHVAAQEVRIKLSELCYKSISSDSTEDKKHIDLSSEPLILVCACGLSHSNATDVAKEVAIFRAHRAMPIVITHASQAHLYSPAEVITTPTTTSPELAFVLATMVGHLFGYESALAIDELAKPLRETRTIIQDALDDTTHRLHPNLLSTLSSALEPLAQQFLNRLHNGNYNGCLQASTATDIASLYRYSTGITPLDVYQLERGIQGTPETVLSQFLTSLGVAINELTRPIDAIRHQAKTVTVGISRR